MGSGTVWTCYLVTRILIGFVDAGTDIAQAFRLFFLSHPIWGSLTLIFPVVGFLMALLAVVFGRIQRGDPMPVKKFVLLTIISLASVFEAFFESGPQLVLQLTIIWRGVLIDDIAILFQEESIGSSQWFFGLLSFAALVSSFVSLTVTSMYYNDEKLRSDRPIKFFVGLGLTMFSILYRVFISSILFAVSPFWVLGISLGVYVITVTVMKATGHSWECLLYGYTSLLCPGGYTKNQGQSSSSVFRAGTVITSPRVPVSEVERAKINQESLFKRVYVVQGLFLGFNYALLFAFVGLIETKLMTNDGNKNRVIGVLLERGFVYGLPCCLLLISTVFTWFYIREIKIYRDFTRTWDAITPKAKRFSVRGGTLGSSPSPLPSAPTIYEQQLPLNPSEYIEVIRETGDRIPHVRPKSPISSNFPKPGNVQCNNDNCVTCDLLIEGTTFRSTMTGKEYRFVTSVSCNTKCVIYLVTCSKCRKQYVGKTEQELRQRHYGHRREIETESTPLGKHFAQSCGYTSWRFQIIDQGLPNELQRREGHWQHELMTLQPWGLNFRDEMNGQNDK